MYTDFSVENNFSSVGQYLLNRHIPDIYYAVIAFSIIGLFWRA